MSNIPQEIHEILEEIVRLTKDRRLEWDTLDFLGDEGVVVSLTSGQLSLARGADLRSIQITVRNEYGTPIYKTTITPSSTAYAEIGETYQLARRQALGEPDTLERMREELAAR